MSSWYRILPLGAIMLVGLFVGLTGLLSVRPAAAARPASTNQTTLLFLPLVMKGTGSGPSQVSLMNIAYNPQVITVTVGTPITWTNDEAYSIPHTVTSGTPGTPSGVFDSPELTPGQSFSFTFTSTGTFAYYCRIHLAAMTGTVNVVP